MSTQTAEVKKQRRTFGVRLHGPKKATLRIAARLKRDGTAVTHVIHSVPGAGGKRQNTRGATATHADLEKAQAAMEKLIADALKLGWIRKERKGFAAQPDAFDGRSLPSPEGKVKVRKTRR